MLQVSHIPIDNGRLDHEETIWKMTAQQAKNSPTLML
jgi:hypothetical protein